MYYFCEVPPWLSKFVFDSEKINVTFTEMPIGRKAVTVGMGQKV